MRQRAYADRAEAGRRLAPLAAEALTAESKVLVLALPRGGVPVAVPVARALGAPLDVLAVRKVGFPGHAELAMGAVAAGTRIRNDEIIQHAQLSPDRLERAYTDAEAALAAQQRRWRGDRPAPDLHDRAVVLVDDGLATGATMRAAVAAARIAGARRVVVAVPVGSAEAVADVGRDAEVVCALVPPDFAAVGAHYRTFAQTSDDEVRAALGIR